VVKTIHFSAPDFPFSVFTCVHLCQTVANYFFFASLRLCVILYLPLS
jgi:hypothetical protein